MLGAMNRARRITQQVGSAPVIFLCVTVGWAEILHSGVWLGTRREDRGTCWPSSWQTDEVVFGNLKAQNKNHYDFDEHVSRVGQWCQTKFKVTNM